MYVATPTAIAFLLFVLLSALCQLLLEIIETHARENRCDRPNIMSVPLSNSLMSECRSLRSTGAWTIDITHAGR